MTIISLSLPHLAAMLCQLHHRAMKKESTSVEGVMVKKVLLVAGLLLVGLGFSAVAKASVVAAPLDYDLIEVAAATGNPDYSPFDNGLGYSLLLSKSLSDIFFLHANYTRAIFAVGGELGGRKLSDWGTLGLGARIAVHPRLHLLTGGSWQGAILDDGTESGYAVHLGLRSQLHDRVEFNLVFSYLDLVITDIQTIGEIYFRMTDSLDLGLRVRDYADWDYTSYEAGLRYHY
jgi:hypothetical protein